MDVTVRSQLLLAACCLCSACTLMPDGSRWGDAATLAPGWQRVRASAVDAVKSPWVWAPLAGAAVLQLDSWDEDVADWASDETPLFGSPENADDWSDGLRIASAVGYGASVLATPSGDLDGDWLLAKAQGAAVGASAFAATAGVTGGLKSLTSRERPDGSGDDSLPSGHASTAAVFDTLTVRNLQSIDVSPAMRTTLGIGAGAMTAGTAWARVEAGRHYPSDVLIGIALGNFMGAFFTEAFLGLEPGTRVAFTAEPVRGGAVLRWDLRF
jgi:membrane-associated phospholipid phosphatase